MHAILLLAIFPRDVPYKPIAQALWSNIAYTFWLDEANQPHQFEVRFNVVQP